LIIIAHLPWQVSLCVKFQLVPGKSIESKSIHLKDKSVFLSINSQILGEAALITDHGNETFDQQFMRIVHDFDQALICRGVKEDKYSQITLCAGAVKQNDGTWRSNRCKAIFSPDNKRKAPACCPDCYISSRALGRLASKLPPRSYQEKLEELRVNYRAAQQKLVRNERKIKVKSYNTPFALMNMQIISIFKYN